MLLGRWWLVGRKRKWTGSDICEFCMWSTPDGLEKNYYFNYNNDNLVMVYTWRFICRFTLVPPRWLKGCWNSSETDASCGGCCLARSTREEPSACWSEPPSPLEDQNFRRKLFLDWIPLCYILSTCW